MQSPPSSFFLLLLGAAACGPSSVETRPVETDSHTDADADTDTDTDADADADTDTDTPVGDCAVDAALGVLSVDAAETRSAELVWGLDVSLSKDAAIGVACRKDGDADETLYWERDAATEHHLDLAGFLPESTYTCTVSPVCPRTGTPGETFTVETGPIPEGLPGLDVVDGDVPTSGPPYLLLNAGPCSGDGDAYMALYDIDGHPRWGMILPDNLWADVVTDYLGDGQFSWGGGYTTDATTHVVDLTGETLAQATWPGYGSETYTHEGHVLDDGRFLSFAWVTNSSGRNTWQGFEIYVSTPDGGLDWSWNSQVASDAGLIPSGRGADSHGNWAEVLTWDDGTERAYASACYLDTILAIDVATSEVIWRLGPDGDFTVVDADGTPLGDEGFTDCQHGVEIDGNHVLVYDNGASRSYSRASEYLLDESTMTATMTWTWTEDNWDADWLGDVDYLPDDHVLITMGEQDCAWSSGDDVKSRVVEVDRATGDVAWRGTFDTDNNLTFRAERVDACDILPDVKWCPDAAAALAEVEGLFPR